MPIVTATGVSKVYGTRTVLSGATLTIRSGERVGVVGSNGSGKSTLAKLLSGLDTPDSGTISRRRGARIRYLEQSPVFEGDPTAEEAVLSALTSWTEALERHRAASAALAAAAGDTAALLEAQARAAEDVERLGGWDPRHRVAAVLGHLGIHRPEARVGTLSGGERRRVALAAVLVARPDLAVLDEPTNHLDAETSDWLEQYLATEHPGAVLLITHDRYLLDNVVTRTLEVAGGEVFEYEGGYERYLEQKAERLAHAERTEQNRQNFLRRELEWLRRQPKARTTKQAARIERVEAAMAAPRPKVEKTARFELDVGRSGKTILELRDLGGAIGGRELFSGLTLFVTEGERIGVVGPNGSGKTTLLKILVGELEPSAGSVTLGKATRIAYFDQQRSGLDDEKSVFENALGDQTTVELGGEVIEGRAYLERFGFDRWAQRQPVGSLSGGERARVALARMLRQRTNLVVMDEPTNDLDVATLAALETMLVESGATALIVTHDRWFLDRVATSILAFDGAGKVERYPGNYQTFKRLSAEAKAKAQTEPAVAAPPKPVTARPSKRKGLTFAEERELEGLLDAVAQAERRVSEIEQKLADPATYAGGGSGVPALNQELSAAKSEVERLTLRWEELESKRQG